jgi:hypothetical protein
MLGDECRIQAFAMATVTRPYDGVAEEARYDFNKI